MKKLTFLLLIFLSFGFNYAYSGNLKKSTTPKTKTFEQKAKEVEQKLEQVEKMVSELEQEGKKLENDCKLICEGICKKTHPENDCKNACSFACEPIKDCPFSYANKIKKCNSIGNDLPINMEVCLSEKSIDYCSNLCRSYLICNLDCLGYYKSPTKFCNRVCEFDPTLKWTYLGFDELGNARFFYIEDINQNIVKAWEKEIYSERGKQWIMKERIQKNLSVKGYKNLDYSLGLHKIDCSKRRHQILEVIDYASDGSILDIADLPEFLAEWYSIPPDSIIEKLFEEVCETEE